MGKLSTLLFRYIAKEFFIKFCAFYAIFLGIIYVFETVELIRRGGGDNVAIHDILLLGIYKLPDVGQQILPFIVLFSAIACFRDLSKRQELVCIRSAGLSVWQFMTPIVTVTFIFSLVFIAVFHPILVGVMKKYESLENIYFGNGSETVTVIDDGLWLKQQDDTGNFILKADELNAVDWTLQNITVFFFDNQNIHIQRIDSKEAHLTDQEWVFKDVSIFRLGQAPSYLPELMLSTTLTRESISESFSNPTTISFWALPYFIESLKATGLDTTEMELYFQSLLSLPFLLIAMVFMAAAVALRTERMATLLPIITNALVFGFLVFFMSGFFRALGIGHEIPTILAIWTMPVIVLMIATSVLSRMEDG